MLMTKHILRTAGAVLALGFFGNFALAELPALSGSYLAGRSASKLRDNDLASAYYGRALDSDAANPVLIEKVFMLALAEGNIHNAELLAERVLSFNSQQRMARIVLGLKEFRQRRYSEARHHFTEASYTPVGELTARLLTAWSYAGEGNLSAALSTLDKLDSNDAFTNFKSFHEALIADYLGNSIRAEAAYRKAYEQASTSLRVMQAFGNFLERSGRSAEALKIYEAFVDGGDRNPLAEEAAAGARIGRKPMPFIATPGTGAAEALFSLASAMTDEPSVDVALLYAQLALSMNADRPVTLTLIGDIYEDIHRPEKAIEAYEMTPAGSALRSNAEIEVAVNLQRLDRKDEAKSRLEALIAREPANFDALVTLGNIHRNNEDYAAAAATYDRAVALIGKFEREHWRVFYYTGISYERQNQWDKAEKNFRRALELAPDEPMVLNYLGYSMIEKKLNLSEALQMVKKAVELKPNDGYIVDSLGWAYYQLGDYEEAVTQIERAVELLPSDPIVGEHLGDAYWRVGRVLEAKFQWQHAKDNKPQAEDLLRIEGKLANGMGESPPVKPAEVKSDQTNG